MKKIILLTALAFTPLAVFAQISAENSDWMQFLEELAESGEIETADLERLFDELSYLSENPINLNTATKQDLERLPFLTDIQVENILYYVYKFGPLIDIYELKNIEDLDFRTMNYLLPFVYAGKQEEKKEKFKLADALKYGKNEVLLRGDYTLQEKAGYADASEEEKAAHPSRYYLGEPYYLSLRYRYQFRNIQVGAAGEKDVGEAFWNANHKGFDYYSFNFNLKEAGILDKLHIGDYRLSFGQGLVMNTNFAMGKTSFVGNINRQNAAISRHVSTGESNFFRGIAASLKLKEFTATFFYSNRLQDANSDSLTILSIKTDGYNRVPNDIKKRRTARLITTGGHLEWRNSNFQVGLSAVYYSFGGKTLNPTKQTYNLFYFRGKEHSDYSIDYAYRNKKISFRGETAIDADGKMATLNNLLFNPISRVELVLSYRNYARDYNAMYGKAFAESSTVQNESGIYSGLKFSPAQKWEIAAYIDFFRFPWLKYGINSPSDGTDGLLQVFYKPKSGFQMNFRYRYKEKSHNVKSEDGKATYVLPYRQHRLRYQADLSLGERWKTKTQTDYNRYSDDAQSYSGWSATQLLTYSPKRGNLQLDGCLGWFKTDNWDTRITLYEKNILYAFSYPSYYGEGLRAYLVAKWKIAKSLTVYLKLANTHYYDRETIGSDLEEIKGKNKTDVYCLLKYGF